MIARRRFLSLAAAFACAPRHASAQQWQGRALGASVSVTLHGPRAEVTAALAAIPGLLEEVEDAFSLYRPTSELVRLNRRGRLMPSPRFDALVATADQAHRLTGGLFDPTVQPLWQALARGANPAPARRAIGWTRLRRASHGALRLAPGQALTFNGIAQGHATDAVRDALRARGFARALVDIGEPGALGGPFRIGLHDPLHGLAGHRTVRDTALATSSPAALPLGAAGHILGPRGETPLWSSVTVAAASATLADGLSTAAVFMDRPALAHLKRAANLAGISVVDTDGNLRTV